MARPHHTDAPAQVIDVAGRGRVAGAAYGEACRDLISSHLDLIYQRTVTNGRSREALWSLALTFRAFVERELPQISSEVDGIADGAGIRLEEGWLLQLRSEVTRLQAPIAEPECTAFGAVGAATRTGTTIAGQNGDLPAPYKDLLVLVRRVGPDFPRYLTITPAGQLAWHGMNELGLCVFANFLLSGGWRVGVPRYLYTRAAFEERGVESAANRLRSLPRAASRNILLADAEDAIDLELGVVDAAAITPHNGRIAHTNHFVAAPTWEQAENDYLEDSRIRLRRIESLMNSAGPIDAQAGMALLGDRGSAPHTISRTGNDRPDGPDFVTVVSTIADVANGHLWVAFGPPHIAGYHRYSV